MRRQLVLSTAYLLAVVTAACSSRASSLTEPVMEGIRTGDITSRRDLGAGTGGFEKWKISARVPDEDIEFPSSALLGKMQRFEKIEETDVEWMLKNQGSSAETAAMAPAILAEERRTYEADQKKTGPIKYGEARMMNGRSDGNLFQYDERIGAKKVVYKVETSSGFYKITFVADDKQIYAIDVHQ